MATVWAELKRRNVVKVAVAYAIVGWILVEITSTVFPILQYRPPADRSIEPLVMFLIDTPQ